MNKIFNISDFKKLSISEKLDFLEDSFIDAIKDFDEKILYSTLRSIVLNSNENAYVRKSALELFTELVILGKVKTRHAYNLLIDDWIPNEDTSLEIQRLKDLLLYYDPINEECGNIELIFKTGIKNSDAEIIGESFFNLGMISLTKAFRSSNENEYKIYIKDGDYYFQKSIVEVENRVDSRFYQKIIVILEVSIR